MSQFQCTYADIEKGICYFLTTRKNQAFTSDEIFASLLTEKICPELNSKQYSVDFSDEFISKCNNASLKFSKIKRLGQYYVFSTENQIDLNLVKDIVDNPQNYPTVTFDSIYAEGETILHILCANGLSDKLYTISQSFNIDPHLKNENGQTLFDVVPNTKEGHQTYKVLFNIFLSQEIARNETKLNVVKESNANLTKKNGELANVNSEMMLTNRKLVSQNTQLVTTTENLKYINRQLKRIVFLQAFILVGMLSYICINFVLPFSKRI